ncbi:MAG: tRNA (adenosine(37)-N6)-dimethylallyltransferase MiaA [Bacillota bacterium]|nr:tRNA (adenosine(37)-N6)-dimethylallyltransferase MiaA [Bacillota bacterium]
MGAEQRRPPLGVITGPTATGKTAVSIALAERLARGAEIVSADSMMVYRGMDIGTAKPSRVEMRGIPHHLIDVAEPDEPFSVARYRELAEAAVAGILARGRLPLLVGGTGLYIRAVLDEYHFAAPPDEGLRRELADAVRHHGPEWLHARLAEVDPVRASAIHPRNVRRVIRALEIFRKTGRPPSSFAPRFERGRERYAARVFGLFMDRERLYRRIEERVDAMLAAGLVAEVEGLLARGYRMDLPSMHGLGYKEIAAYLAGEIPYEEAVALLKRNTRRYAKRQFTWFKTDPRIHWIEVGENADPMAVAEQILVLTAGEPDWAAKQAYY